MSHAASGTPPTANAKKVVGGIIIAASLLVGILGPVIYDRFRTPPPAPTATAEAPALPANVVLTATGHPIYKFGNEGCVTKYLTRDTDFYPKGGAVIITTPSGVSWRDVPGQQIDLPRQEVGNYKICKDEPGAWGVEVRQ